MLKRRAAKAGIEKRVHVDGLRNAHDAKLAAERVPVNVISKQPGRVNSAATVLYRPHRPARRDRCNAGPRLDRVRSLDHGAISTTCPRRPAHFNQSRKEGSMRTRPARAICPVQHRLRMLLPQCRHLIEPGEWKMAIGGRQRETSRDVQGAAGSAAGAGPLLAMSARLP